MKRNKQKKVLFFKYLLISLLVLIAAVLVAAVTNLILTGVYRADNPVDHVVGMLEGIIGAIATGLVLFQLKSDEKAERHKTDIEEAAFTLQYNQAFIQDANMVEVEHLLESQAYYDTEPREIVTPENRQKFINYLVYLESMAPLILTNVLALDYIDNLMAYRYFLAVDNVELQEKELLPFADYYRGCYELYRIWKPYREKMGLNCPVDDCRNKDAMRSLNMCGQYHIVMGDKTDGTTGQHAENKPTTEK